MKSRNIGKYLDVKKARYVNKAYRINDFSGHTLNKETNVSTINFTYKETLISQ